MAAPASITLKNAANADVVFTVHKADGDKVVWVHKPANTPMSGYIYMTLSRKDPGNVVNGATVASLVFDYPNLDPVTLLLKSINRVTENVVIPVASPTVTNDNLASFAKSANADAVVQSFFKDGTLPQ